jgi:hypothetical protein
MTLVASTRDAGNVVLLDVENVEITGVLDSSIVLASSWKNNPFSNN